MGMSFADACTAFQSRLEARYEAASITVAEQARAGLSDDEVEQLTRSIAASADPLQLPPELAPIADVPSTGAPGSLSTLLCPLLLTSMNIRVPKLSATGSVSGGIDSMEIIPGFRSTLTADEFVRVLRLAGFAHSKPFGELCPADTALIRARRKLKLMDNRFLAAASLLAKKLSIPGTHACFDFRVGPTGNIGAEPQVAIESAQLFVRIARRLNISIAAVLTDNRTFPCSVVGRIESLKLLHDVLTKRRLNEIDSRHVETCITLAAHACLLVQHHTNAAALKAQLQRRLKQGDVKECMERHLCAQGSTWEQFEMTAKSREEQHVILVQAEQDGFWIPPRLEFAKEWIKTAQQSCDDTLASLPLWRRQVGIRLIAMPGTLLRKGGPVLEIAFPAENVLAVPREFAGTSIATQPQLGPPILDIVVAE